MANRTGEHDLELIERASVRPSSGASGLSLERAALRALERDPSAVARAALRGWQQLQPGDQLLRLEYIRTRAVFQPRSVVEAMETQLRAWGVAIRLGTGVDTAAEILRLKASDMLRVPRALFGMAVSRTPRLAATALATLLQAQIAAVRSHMSMTSL